MKLSVLLVVVCALGIVRANGQEIMPITSTSTSDTARFEIIQPSYAATLTFRLDKFTGTVHRLGTCPKDDGYGSDKCWKEMIVVDQPRSANAGRARYQLVINNVARTIFLLQIDSGRSWQYGIDPEGKWWPFIECIDRSDRNCLWRP